MKLRRWAAAAAATVLVTGLAACGTKEPTNPDDPKAGWPDEIILGLVPSQEVDKLVEDAKVLANLISEELGHPVTHYVPTDYTALVVALGNEQAHIGMFGPVALIQAERESDAITILQSVRRGSPTYHTQWFTNNTERFCSTPVVEAPNPEGNVMTYCNGTDTAEKGPVGEESLKLIKQGESISFVDAASASGYYYPATQVKQLTGLDPLTQIDGQFAGGHPNSVLNVARGDFEIGVSFDDARNNLVAEDPEIGKKVTVFAWSTEIPNDGVAVSGDLPESLRTAFHDAFLAVMATEEGKAAFRAVYSIEGLVEADPVALNATRAMYDNFG